MTPPNKDGNWQSTPVFILVALLAAGAFLAQGPLEGERPRPQNAAAHLDRDNQSTLKADARLWQDPFGAVARQESKQPGSSNDKPNLTTLTSEAASLCTTENSCIVLGVMVVGGPYVGMEEHRRSTRYAVLHGLQQQGFHPVDPEHISYVKAAIPKGGLTVVPFEWLRRDKDEDDWGFEDPKFRKVLVLWLNEEQFGAEPTKTGRTNIGAKKICPTETDSTETDDDILARLVKVFGPFLCADKGGKRHYSAALIGPIGSGTLKKMATAPSRCNGALQELKNLNAYSSYATSDEAWESIENPLCCLSGEIHPLKVTRVNAKDSELTDALVRELTDMRHIRLRKVEKPQADVPVLQRIFPQDKGAVLLVAQRDTAYSRHLIELFKERVDSDRIYFAYYLRGIDGKLGDSPGQSASSDKKDKDKDKDKDRGAIERPEGDGQVDYLRRLASDLLVRQMRERMQIRAVGIVGDDYHDKLLVLKALRPMFPQAVFFTTDLNAAMLHPADNGVTRTMLVASGFGLSLHHSIQAGVPPFRDSYQTATYLATRVAVGDIQQPGESIGKLIKAKRTPPLFEIGRTTAVPLNDCIDGDDTKFCSSELRLSESSQPKSDWPPLFRRMVAGIGLSLIAGIWLAALLFKVFKELLYTHWRMLTVVGVIIVPVLGLVFAGPPRLLDEPFLWLEGVSVWPTQILRGLSFLLTLLFIHLAIDALRKADNDTTKKFALPQDVPQRKRRPLKGDGVNRIWCLYRARGISVTQLNRLYRRALPMHWGMRKALQPAWLRAVPYVRKGLGWFRLGRIAASMLEAWFKPNDGKLSQIGRHLREKLQPIWSPVVPCARIVLGRPAVTKIDAWLKPADREPSWTWGWSEVLRNTWFRVFLYVAIGFGLFRALGVPVPLARGDSVDFNFWLMWCGIISFPFLLLFVLDASRRAIWLAHRLERCPDWPEETLRQFGLLKDGDTKNDDTRLFDRWLDVQLIASATAQTGRLTYYPFIVFFIALVARNPLFDNWSLVLPLAFVYLLAIALMLAAGFRLRRGAERVRSNALRCLQDELLREQVQGGAREKLIQTMIERIRNIRTGVFSPFTQQPLVRAILGVVSGASGLALLEYASLANL